MLVNFDIFLVVLVPAWVLLRILRIRKSNSFLLLRELAVTLFFLSVLVLINFTIFPIPVGIRRFDLHFNFVPFSSIYGSLHHSWYIVPLRQLAGNMLLFMPIGFFIPLLWEKLRNLWKVTLLGFSLSFSIEFLQLTLLANMRSADVDDIILNTIGTILGYSIYRIIFPLANHVIIREMGTGACHHISNLPGISLAAVKKVRDCE